MTHPAYTWEAYPCTGTANFESVARNSLQKNMENNIDEEQRLLAIEDWSAFNPGSLPGTLLQDTSVNAGKIYADNAVFNRAVPVYNSSTGEFVWENVDGVVGGDTYTVRWESNGGAANLEDFVATNAEAVSGTANDALMTPLRTAEAINALLPAGMVVPFGGLTAPTGWIYCDGRSLARSLYPRLFAYLGTLHGSVDSSSFNVPDYRGRFLRGDDTRAEGTGVDPDSPRAVGSEQEDEFKSHTHGSAADPDRAKLVNGSTTIATGTGYTKEAALPLQRGYGLLQDSGGDETRPINSSVLYCIKE